MTLKEIQQRYVLAVLHKHGGNRKQTGLELGVGLRTLSGWLREWKIPRRAAGPKTLFDLVVVTDGGQERIYVQPEPLTSS